MRKVALYTDGDLELVRVLKKEKTLGAYIFLCSVKRVSGINIITHEEKRNLHKKIAYSKSSVSKYFRQLVKLGWADKTKDGYYLISYGRIARDRGITTSRFRKVQGESKREVLARAAGMYIKSNLKAQYKKEYTARRKDKIGDIIRYYDPKVKFTVRKLAKLMGCSTPMSGTNLFREMDRLDILKRKRVDTKVCSLEEFNGHTIQANLDRLWIDWNTLTVMRREASLIKIM